MNLVAAFNDPDILYLVKFNDIVGNLNEEYTEILNKIPQDIISKLSKFNPNNKILLKLVDMGDFYKLKDNCSFCKNSYRNCISHCEDCINSIIRISNINTNELQKENCKFEKSIYTNKFRDLNIYHIHNNSDILVYVASLFNINMNSKQFTKLSELVDTC